MSSILSNYHEFNFSESYAYAGAVRKHIFDKECDIEIVDLASNFDKQVANPQKRTLLHDYIDYIVTADIEFYFSGSAWDYGCVEPVFSILENHRVSYKSLEQYIVEYLKDDINNSKSNITGELEEKYEVEYALDYLKDVAISELTPILVKEVFTLLFNDREAMKEFNVKLANEIGVKTERCTHWNEWLKKALVHREKGLCAICKADLTGVYNRLGKLAVDHIVPINLNGVNDPTNLQVLCQKCNVEKGGNEIVTSNSMPLFWE